eukprot:4497206-Alexandrium_andersonii.AAC.1
MPAPEGGGQEVVPGPRSHRSGEAGGSQSPGRDQDLGRSRSRSERRERKRRPSREKKAQPL